LGPRGLPVEGDLLTVPAAVRIVEVGPRDGLQNEKAVIPLEAKLAFVEALSKTGLREIEAGAFVSPAKVPQMADSAEVFRQVRREPGVVYSALVPNEKGLEAALAVKADKIAVFTAASERFNQGNIGASIEESLERFGPVCLKAREAKVPVRGYLSTAFWCPYEGKVDPRKAVEVSLRLLGLGVDELSIGDTIGKATADDVKRLLDLLCKAVPASSIFLHFHDTFHHAVANALAAWRGYGISGFDSSAGGMGGCPYAPGASGNVATEALLAAFEEAGAAVPARPDAVAEAVETVARHLGRPLKRAKSSSQARESP